MIPIRDLFMFCVFTWFVVLDVVMLCRAVSDKNLLLQFVYELALAGAIVCAVIFGSGAVYLHIQSIENKIQQAEVQEPPPEPTNQEVNHAEA